VPGLRRGGEILGGRRPYGEADVEGVVGVVQLFEEMIHVQVDVHVIVACDAHMYMYCETHISCIHMMSTKRATPTRGEVGDVNPLAIEILVVHVLFVSIIQRN
jgi:hypothetical protein